MSDGVDLIETVAVVLMVGLKLLISLSWIGTLVAFGVVMLISVA